MTTVVIPWRGGCTHRDRALRWVLEQWASHFPHFTVLLGEHVDGPWCKAAAVTNALRGSTTGCVVVADADVWVEASAIAEAVESVQTHGWAIPHGDVCRLTEGATSALIAGEPLGPDPYVQAPYPGWAGGGMVATTADTYRAAPLDPRFVGWGQEDASWALAMRTMVGEPWRGTAQMLHLFHPPQARKNRRIGSPESAALHERYRRAYRKPELMRQLLEEAA